MAHVYETVGLIAGSKGLPLLFAQQARAMGTKRIVAVGFDGETDPQLANFVDEIVWLKVGQLGKLIDVFTKRQIAHCVMLGQIAPKNLFDFRPDMRALGILLRLKEKNAHTIFGALCDEMTKEGIEMLDARPWLKPAMPQAGFCLGPKLSEEQQSDLAFGFRIAKEISRLEIGQSVVVKNGTVLAVEGFEGTDACLRRGGELAGKGGGALAVKVAKENHDTRFDIPCIGARTLEICREAQISVLGFEGGMTLVLERDAVEEFAKKNKITVVAAG